MDTLVVHKNMCNFNTLKCVCRKPMLVKKGMDLWEDLVERRRVVLFQKAYHKLEEKLKRWEKELNGKMPITIEEFVDFKEY